MSETRVSFPYLPIETAARRLGLPLAEVRAAAEAAGIRESAIGWLLRDAEIDALCAQLGRTSFAPPLLNRDVEPERPPHPWDGDRSRERARQTRLPDAEPALSPRMRKAPPGSHLAELHEATAARHQRESGKSLRERFGLG